MTTDFAQLYLQLGIRNDCTLEEFKQACRRRIRQQHPDRLGGRESPQASQAALADLLSLYAKALRFHRRHGRLPGALATGTTAGPPGSGLRPTTQPPPVIISPPVAADAVTPPPRPIPLRNPALVLAAVVAALTGLNAWNGTPTTADPNAGNIATPLPPPVGATALPAAAPPADLQAATGDGPASAPPPRMIEIGMDAATVRALQGAPLQSDGSEWIYGPSWIRFEEERVVDWYSSPLYHLKTRTVSP